MSADWKQSPKVLVLAVAAIVLLTGVVIYQILPKRSGTEKILAGNLQYAVGYVAAEETAKLMAGGDGRVVLLFAGREQDFAGSTAAAYERGFREALDQQRGLQWQGHYCVEELAMNSPDPEMRRLSRRVFQAPRLQYPQANVLVSFIGLPEFTAAEETQWRAAGPPKLVVAEVPGALAGRVPGLLQQDLIQLAFVFKPDQRFPDTEPRGKPRAVFEQYYEVLKR